MKKINNFFDYKQCQTILDTKQKESDTLLDTINHIMEILHKIYYTKSKKHIFFLSKEIKFTKEVDPSYYLVLKYAIGNIQNVIIDLPLICYKDSIMINGNMYNPILQMIDRPLIVKKKNTAAVFMSNLGNIYSTPIVGDKLIRIISGLNKKFAPPALVWFLAFLGDKAFEEITGAKFMVEDENLNMPLTEFFINNKIKFNTNNLKDEFKTDRFMHLLSQGPFISKEIKDKNIADKLIGLTVKQLLDERRLGWSTFLAAYDGARILAKIATHQTLVPIIDIFTSKFMKYNCVVKEMLRAFSTELDPMTDLKDLKMKRIRCYEIFLITLLKHVYNIGMNCMYNKISSISREKRLRIYDNALSSNLTSYDGERNNSLMRLSERTKISQTGEGGYSDDMFVGSVRDIHESQYGTICPINTPDREKCGATLYLAPSKISKFNDMYYWPSNDEHQDIRMPLKNSEEYEIFMEEEKIRLEKDKLLKSKYDSDIKADINEKLKNLTANNEEPINNANS